MAFSRRPRPLAPLPAPPLFSKLLIGGAPLGEDSALLGLVLSAPRLHLAPAGPGHFREFFPPDSASGLRALWSAQKRGLISLDSPEDRRRALRMVQEAPSELAIVAGAGPELATLVAAPTRERSLLWTIAGVSFDVLHTAVLSCDWLLRMNGSGNVCLYSTLELGTLGRRALTFDELPTLRGPRRGPPIPEKILGTLATATRVDLSDEDEVTDLRALLQAPKLRELVVDGISWLDIDTIAALQTLRSLSMRSTWVEDLSFLERLSTLEHLVIDTPPTQGWAELSRLPQLRRIDAPPDVPLPQGVLGRGASR